MTKAALRDLLREVYEQHGPRQRGLRVVPPEKFAAMTPEEIDQWDFEERYFMHRVAKAIVSA